MAELPDLDGLPWFPYLQEGLIDSALEGAAGVYAVFDRDKDLAYVGISRDIALSLKQHLVRVPDRCYWYKVWTIDSLNRNLLTEIQQFWQAGRVIDRLVWEKPIDCRGLMTDSEKEKLEQAATDREAGKILKDVARRVEEEILDRLQGRGVTFTIRFNPKRKEEGLLDLKV